MNSVLRTTAPIRQLSRSFSATAGRGNLNKIQLIGRVGGDPTVTDVGDERRVVNYSLATSETHPDKEGNLIKRTQWHRIVSWNSADWLPERVKKGDLVYVEGQLRYSDYTDKEGVQRTKADVYQSNFRFLASSRSNADEDDE